MKSISKKQQHIDNDQRNSNNKNPKQEIQNTIFRDGDRVVHETFGEGLVVASQGDVITVAFSKSGLKKLSVNIAPLKKIK